MPAMDVGYTSPAVTVVERAPSSNSMLEEWGKRTSSSLFSTRATHLSSSNRCYVLLVDEQPVFVVVSEDRHDGALRESDFSQPAVLAQRLDWIKDRLGLSITQMAELFGVTRKSVYDWYEGKGQRSSTSIRMEILIDVLNLVRLETDLRRLKTVWNMAVSGNSFREVFGDDKLDAAALRAALNEKLNELSPRMVATTRFVQKQAVQLSQSQLAEFDRRTDFD